MVVARSIRALEISLPTLKFGNVGRLILNTPPDLSRKNFGDANGGRNQGILKPAALAHAAAGVSSWMKVCTWNFRAVKRKTTEVASIRAVKKR